MNRLAAMLIVSLFAASAHAGEYQCPEKIETSGDTAQAANGFEAWQDKNKVHYLEGVTMYSGHPDDNASLVPDVNKDSLDVWKFSPDDKYGNWIACNYSNTTQALIKKIGAGIKSCSAYKKPKALFITIECK